MSFTLTPAYGRDYKSRAAVLSDFDDDKDFIDQSFEGSGKPVNKSQIRELGGGAVKLRYNGIRREVTINVKAG